MSGVLYLCATPIGNLEDMTFRAIRVLQEADLIAAEDTRNSIRLLNHFDIKTPMTSYHEYNKIEKAKYLVGQLMQGKNVAVITDAGTPGISDPGEELVRMCLEQGILVTAVPGPAALITALVSSGQATRRFCFEGFLPSEKKERRLVLDEIKEEFRTILMYEAPHHLLKTLEELREALGNRSLTIARELTKRYETIQMTTLEEACEYYKNNEPRGEYVLVIAGQDREAVKKQQQESWQEISLEEHMQQYLSKGMDRKEAMKQVAKDRGVSKREVYQQLLDLEA